MKLVLVRHGQSVWNMENRFTGWTDVALSEQGEQEAKTAGQILKEAGYQFDLAYTSVLKRAIDTLDIILEELDQKEIPIYQSWKLNERHYGALQGLNKAETASQYGQEQVHLWRRSADVRPPALEVSDTRYPGNDEKYQGLTKDQLPTTECLLDTGKRVVSYFQEVIKQELLQEKQIIIVAHGNSIRALIQYLDEISDAEITKLEIPTGKPLVYELDARLKPIRHYYLEEKNQ